MDAARPDADSSPDAQGSASGTPDEAPGTRSSLADALRVDAKVVKLRRDPVPDNIISECLRAASAAAPGEPRCKIVVLRDADRKHQIARIYRQGWSVYRRLLQLRGSDLTERQWEADHFEDVPIVMIGCALGQRPILPAIGEARYYASVLPAMQNLMLTARSLGVAASLSTLPVWSGWQARRTLDLPVRVTPVVVATLGWPAAALTQHELAVPSGFAMLDHYGQDFPVTDK